MSRRIALITVTVVVVGLAVTELMAPSFVRARVSSAVAACQPDAEVAVDGPSRPVLAGLAAGRLRDLEVTISGARVGDLRLAEVSLAAEDWPFADRGGTHRAQLDVRVEVADVRSWVAERTPAGSTPTVRFDGGEVVVGVPGIGLELGFVAELGDDEVALVPALGAPSWWQRLGVALVVPVPAGVELEDVDIGEGRVHATGRLLLPPEDLADGCVAGETAVGQAVDP